MFTENIFFSWQAPEYDHSSKSIDWYWAMGIAAAVLFTTAILLKNFLFAVIVILGTFSVTLFSARKPRIINFSFTPRGVQIEKKKFLKEERHEENLSETISKYLGFYATLPYLSANRRVRIKAIL